MKFSLGHLDVELIVSQVVPATITCLAVLLISARYSVDPSMSMWGRFDSWAYGVLACTLYAAVMFLSCRRPPSRRGLEWLGVLLSIHAVMQKADLDPFIRAAVLPAGRRAIGYVGSPTDLAAILAMLFFMCSTPLSRLAVLTGIAATGSRGGMLAVGFGWAAMLFPRRARWIAMLSLGFFLLPARQHKDLARREVWLAAVDVFKQHPILGSGPDTFIDVFTGERLAMFRALLNPMSTQAQAHNDFLQAAATTGILGLLAYLWLLAALPAAPALVALFVFMKFNPVALEVLAIGAMIAGLEIKERLSNGQ